jgi:hypothetical protein
LADVETGSQDVRMELDSFYDRLKLAAAAKLQPWHEHKEGLAYHIWLAGITISIAEAASTSRNADYQIVARGTNEEQQNRLVALIDYPRLCAKATVAKHLGLTLRQLKELLDGWGYEHVCSDPRYPNNYTQMVIVKTALLCAERNGLTARIPVRQETACLWCGTMWMREDSKGRSFPCPVAWSQSSDQNSKLG